MSRLKRYYVEINDSYDILKTNDDFLEYIGSKKVDNIESIIQSHDFLTLKDALPSLKPSENTFVCFRMYDKDDKANWMSVKVHRSKHKTSLIRLDIYDLQTLEMNISEGYYDEMTGVLSKGAITDYAKKLMEQTPSKQFYFFIMDIDNFKSINDTYGHMKGDEIIIEVANIANECVADKGLVGRIGGDEFIIVLEKIHEEPELRDVLRDIRYNVREKYIDENNNFTITVSLGGGLFPDQASNYEDMFKLADKMLYIAKAKGRDRYIIYTPSIHGNLKNDTEVVIISRRTKRNQAKNTFIMDIMANFLLKDSISVNEAFQKVIETYTLDEVFLISKKTGKTIFGLTSNGDNCELDISYLSPEDYQPFFEVYPLRVVNLYDLQKANYLKFSELMLSKGFRIIIVYYMRNDPDGKYLLYVSNVDSACRFAETDLSDLIYFSKMLELSERL